MSSPRPFLLQAARQGAPAGGLAQVRVRVVHAGLQPHTSCAAPVTAPAHLPPLPPPPHTTPTQKLVRWAGTCSPGCWRRRTHLFLPPDCVLPFDVPLAGSMAACGGIWLWSVTKFSPSLMKPPSPPAHSAHPPPAGWTVDPCLNALLAWCWSGVGAVCHAQARQACSAPGSLDAGAAVLALPTCAGLEQLEIFVNGHRVNDVLDVDACTRGGTSPTLNPGGRRAGAPCMACSRLPPQAATLMSRWYAWLRRCSCCPAAGWAAAAQRWVLAARPLPHRMPRSRWCPACCLCPLGPACPCTALSAAHWSRPGRLCSAWHGPAVVRRAAGHARQASGGQAAGPRGPRHARQRPPLPCSQYDLLLPLDQAGFAGLALRGALDVARPAPQLDCMDIHDRPRRQPLAPRGRPASLTGREGVLIWPTAPLTKAVKSSESQVKVSSLLRPVASMTFSTR